MTRAARLLQLRHLTLDLISAWLAIASLQLWTMRPLRFIDPLFFRTVRLVPFLFAMLSLTIFLQMVRRMIPRHWFFTWLPGMMAWVYLFSSLFQKPEPAYLIGVMLLTLFLAFLLKPVYERLWQSGSLVARILILIQIVIAMFLAGWSGGRALVELPSVPSIDRISNASITPELLLKPTVLALAAAFLAIALRGMMRRFSVGSRLHRTIFPSSLAQAFPWLIAVFAAFSFLAVGLVTSARVTALHTPTYDMGLFTQMFHYMRTTGLPLSTLERSQLLSHFAVHISPIFYLMLPFYAIFPQGETLQWVQAAVVMSGFLPLLLLTRHLKIRRALGFALVLIYLFHPGLIGSSLYDVHENCFLAPILLWLFYAVERRKTAAIAILAVLLLAVKEDATLYLAVYGLFLLVSGRRRRLGILFIAAAVIWLMIAVQLLRVHGEGAMFGRYDNLIPVREWGLAAIPLTFLLSPGYFLHQIFTIRKLLFLLIVLASIGFLPLLQRRWSNLILLIPIVVLNLLPSYGYQYELYYQYHYGTTVFMLLAVVMIFSGEENRSLFRRLPEPVEQPPAGKAAAIAGPAAESADIIAGQPASTAANATAGATAGEVAAAFAGPAASSPRIRLTSLAVGLLTMALIISPFVSGLLLRSRLFSFREVLRNSDELRSAKQVLDRIPADASVIADGFLTTYLANRDTLYDIEYNLNRKERHVADYVIVAIRYRVPEKLVTYQDELREQGYTVWLELPARFRIWVRPGVQLPDAP